MNTHHDPNAESGRSGHFTLSKADVQLRALSSSLALEDRMEQVHDLGGECFLWLQDFPTSSH